jgi:hypothetical protein
MQILNENSWFLKYSPSYEYKKTIIINNVNDRTYIERLLEEIIKKKFSNVNYFFVEDFEKISIKNFNLEIDKNQTLGYYYIIPYFTLIDYLDSEYIFHISEDCTKNIFFDDNFVKSSIDSLNKNPNLLSTTLSFGLPKQSFGYDVGEWEQIESFRYKNLEIKNDNYFWYSLGFSDQVFVAKTNLLKKIDYNLETRENPICFGTTYCPDSWERRVAEYMYQNNLYRGIWKNSEHYYLHGK